MSDLLHLSRYKLQTFETCQRRFQLRYVTQLAWPSAPVGEVLAAAFDRGEQFHRLLEQHFLNLPVTLPPGTDEEVVAWWRQFRQRPPSLPDGRRFPEVNLSVPVGDGVGVLFGRFDLLILSDERAHIFDWKTERQPRPAAALRDDWQTRLYLALLAEGGAALGRPIAPEQIALTYWFVRAPEQSVTIQYDAAWHARNWADIRATIGRIERRLSAPTAIWPLVESWEPCQACNYRTFCGRDAAPQLLDEADLIAQNEDASNDVMMEPDLP
jgi:hypothetical protein